MHDRGPAANVDLHTRCSHTRTRQLLRRSQAYKNKHAHVRKHTGRARVRHARGERREPALGLPLVRVGAPDCRVAVRAEHVEPDGRARGDEELVDGLAVGAGDRL